MVRKKWITRQDVSAARDATRLVKVAVLIGAEESIRDVPQATNHRKARSDRKLNENQRTLIETLAASGGRLPVEALRDLDVPPTTLGTLVRRGLVELVDEPQSFTTSKLKPRQSPFEFEFSIAQKAALAKIGEAVASRKFGGLLLHGITGSRACARCWSRAAPRSCSFLKLA